MIDNVLSSYLSRMIKKLFRLSVFILDSSSINFILMFHPYLPDNQDIHR